MTRGVAIVVAALLVVAGCGHDTKRDPVADAGASLSRVQRGTLHLRLDLGAGDPAQPARVGFEMDGQFDLAPAGASLPVVDLTTTNLGAPTDRPVQFVSTGHDAYVVRDGVGYELSPDALAPLRLDGASSSITGIDLRGWAIDPAPQPATTTSAGEAVDRITGGVDPVAALNGIVDFAGQLGGGADTSLRIAPTDAGRIHSAVRSSSLEVLVGHDDHLMRGLTAHVEFAAPEATSSGGAVVQALNKLGRVTLTIELRIEHPNTAVAVTTPAQVRPFSDLRGG